jgi:hypothetical protein
VGVKTKQKYLDTMRAKRRAAGIGPHMGHVLRSTPRAAIRPNRTDLHWAAGFLEGEGTFARCGPGAGGQLIEVPQTEREPLEYLQNLFGGSISCPRTNHLGKKPVFRWRVCGSRARGVMLTLYVFMFSRRKSQMRKALALVWN